MALIRAADPARPEGPAELTVESEVPAAHPRPRSAAAARLQYARRRFRKAAFRHAENIIYRMCGLPIVVHYLLGLADADPDRGEIKRAYAKAFWSPDTIDQWFDIFAAAALFPLGVLIAACWYSWKNGRTAASRSGRSVTSQWVDQIVCAVSTGVLPPWYYIFELFRPDRRSAARDYLSRAETKQCVFPLLSSPPGAKSPLGDKADFATFCEERQLATAPVILVARRGRLEWRQDIRLPDCDLFIKPVAGRGGKGAERWDFSAGSYRSISGREISPAELLDRIAWRSNGADLVVQPRIRNHAALDGLSNGVLTTVRVLTCLDERREPEVISAVFRMAIGTNRTVDNIHAGGIAAPVDLATGRLGAASDLGMDARLGWLDHHPDTGRKITGEALPMWNEVLALAVDAHRAFSDRAVIGWDIGITPEGAILVEGNYGPDIDLMQRPSGVPLGRGRFPQLIAHHLRAAGASTDRSAGTESRGARA